MSVPSPADRSPCRPSPGARRWVRRLAGLPAAFLLLAALVAPLAAQEPRPAKTLRQKQLIETARLGIERPGAITYAGEAGRFLVLRSRPAGAPPVAEVGMMDRFHDDLGAIRLPEGLEGAGAVAYDRHRQRLLVVGADARSLIALPGDATGGFDGARAVRLEMPRVGPLRIAGLAVDPQTGEVFLLDRLLRRVLRFTPPAADAEAGALAAIPTARRVEIGALASAELGGLAFDPASRHLFTLDVGRRVVHELDLDGNPISAYDVSTAPLSQPASMVFAPSGDQTDDPATLSLYIADPGAPGSRRGHVLELAWDRAAPAVSEETGVQAAAAATLVRVTATSNWSPPSTDPTGITYDPVNARLMISDAEVEELSFWAGKNVWETTLPGSVLRSYNVTSFTIEPTDVAYDPANRQLYISDDDADKVFVLSPGTDGVFGTGDDQLRSFTTRTFNATDAEGIAYDRVNRRLLIADGVNEEIYILRPGPNGIFDGIPPVGDDLLSQFDTTVLGVRDPEAVEYKDDTGTVLLVSSTSVNRVREVTITGTPVADIDIGFASITRAAGLAFGPTSNNPGGRSIYLLDARSWHSNDGRLVEVNISTQAVNTAPMVNAGANQTITLPATATLSGSVTDDGLPIPPGAVTTAWSKVSGPGTVTFGNAAAASTTASFSAAGTYVLQLTANDGALSGSAQTTVTVQSAGSGNVLDLRIASGADDAEESATGSVNVGNGDLELVYDRSLQTVGLRFQNVTIPKGATIATAHIQFQADERHSEQTDLVLQGQAADNPPAFTSASQNVSGRARTAASVAWSPAAWNTVGEAGPAQRTSELKTVIQELVNRSGWVSGNALAIIVTGTGRRTAESYEGLAAAAPLLHVEFTTGGPPPTNAAPIVNAGANQTITLPASATLSGTVTDDGLPNPPAAVTTAWSKVSGPGTVTFGNAAATNTTVSFSAAGTYVLQLTANDGALSGSGQTTVTVQAAAANTAPVVNAGPNQTITLPAAATLSGSVTDDGLPNPPAAVTTAWSKVSGPGTVTFGNAAATNTTVSFSAAGTYVLQLTANDGALSGSGQTTVTVQPAGSSTVLDLRIASGADDVEESATGSVYTNSTDLELVFDGSNQTVGLRFANVAIPKGATITSAYIQFQADEAQSELTNLTLQGEAADHAPAFTSANLGVSGRARTAASVAWSPAAWNTVGEAGLNQRTSELKTVIQELVNRAGWVSGNALAILISGTGHRTAESYEGVPAAAPLLHVEFSGGAAAGASRRPIGEAGR